MIQAKPFALKSVQVSDRIADDVSLKQRVEQATEVLRRESGTWASDVDARWDVQPSDDGAPTLTIRLDDTFGASADRRLDVDEINDEDSLSIIFMRLWGDLLQERNHRQLADLRAAIENLEDD